MRPLRYSINVTLDGCVDHRSVIPDEELHRRAAESIARAVAEAWTMKPDGETWRGCTEDTAKDVSMRAIGG